MEENVSGCFFLNTVYNQQQYRNWNNHARKVLRHVQTKTVKLKPGLGAFHAIKPRLFYCSHKANWTTEYN